jgi:hypothetical protein
MEGEIQVEIHHDEDLQVFGELKQISTLVNPFRTRRWLSKSLLRMNPRPHFEGWHSRSTWNLVLCLNLAGNRG